MSSQSTTALESLVAMGFGEDESKEVRPPPRPSHAPSRFGRVGVFVVVVG
jgi:hypothetical protein